MLRRDTLIFSGNEIPAFQPNENCSNIARTLMIEKLSIDPPSVLLIVWKSYRPLLLLLISLLYIIEKFFQRDSKDQIYSAARTVKQNGLCVDESLTPARRSILHALRQIKRAHPQLASSYSSVDGKVFANTKPSPKEPFDLKFDLHLFLQTINVIG